MSDGCEGCIISSQGQNELLQSTRTKAKSYAVEKSETVAIYREGYEFLYCIASIAIEGKYNIVEFVSQYNSASA
jgi:hypothetical protein